MSLESYRLPIVPIPRPSALPPPVPTPMATLTPFQSNRKLHVQPNPMIPRSRDPLRLVPEADWQAIVPHVEWAGTTRCWRSHAWMVRETMHDGHVTLNVCRPKVGLDGRWLNGITWDDLQWIKAQCGYAEAAAVEVFPPDADVVNGSNMRHLHVLSEIPAYVWRVGV